MWGVDGAYTYYTNQKYKIKNAILVDFYISDAARQVGKSQQHLRFIQGNFGDKAVAGQVGQVDAVFLFDVLLHQVSPDWDDILRLYSKQTKYFVIYNQQWTKSEQTVRLLDLGREEYFKNVPHDKDHPTYKALFDNMNEISPAHQRPWKDIPDVWQWGITDRDLVKAMENLGFNQKYYKDCGRFGTLPHFSNHAFLFQKS